MTDAGPSAALWAGAGVREMSCQPLGRHAQNRIDATKADVKINKRKGGTQKVGISCNSDTLYADNKNWELTKTPDWCEVTATSGNEITIKADALTKNDPEFKSGRTGYIRIESQNEEFIIRVDQK